MQYFNPYDFEIVDAYAIQGSCLFCNKLYHQGDRVAHLAREGCLHLSCFYDLYDYWAEQPWLPAKPAPDRSIRYQDLLASQYFQEHKKQGFKILKNSYNIRCKYCLELLSKHTLHQPQYILWKAGYGSICPVKCC